MLIPKINKSTVDNITNEFLRTTSFDYILDKIDQLSVENPALLECVKTLAKTIYVDNDDASEIDKKVNELRCVAICLIIINVINTEMEIEWLKR